MRAGATLAAALLVGAALARPAEAQSRFRASLTATVIIPPTPDHGKQMVTQSGRPAASQALGCREVSLHWAELPAAKSYVVYVAARSAGPWSALPASNVCGAVRPIGSSGLIDIEPTTGAPAVVHRLYYKVFALPSASPDATPLDVTDPIGVELP